MKIKVYDLPEFVRAELPGVRNVRDSIPLADVLTYCGIFDALYCLRFSDVPSRAVRKYALMLATYWRDYVDPDLYADVYAFVKKSLTTNYYKPEKQFELRRRAEILRTAGPRSIVANVGHGVLADLVAPGIGTRVWGIAVDTYVQFDELDTITSMFKTLLEGGFNDPN